MNTKNYNRAAAIGATLVFLTLSLLVAKSTTPKKSDPIAKRPSTFFTDPTGARALLLVMRRFVPLAEAWRQPLYRLDGSSAADSLIVADPKLPLGERELAALDHWISAGGQLILLSQNGWPLRGQRSDADAPAEPVNDTATGSDSDEPIATYLSRYAPGLRWAKAAGFKTEPATGPSVASEGEIRLRWRQSFAAIGGADAIAAADHQTLAVKIDLGRGRIVAVADPTMVSNGSLRRSDNAVWLVNLVASWGNGQVLFDEYHHGFGAKKSAASLAWAFSLTPWGWCLWQAAVAGLLYIFCYRRRFGRISERPDLAVASPLDLVDARAGFFQAAGARRLAARLILQNLFQELSRVLGRTADLRSLGAPPSVLAPEKLAQLKTLALKTERGENIHEDELLAMGRLAGTIERSSQALRAGRSGRQAYP